MTIQNFEFQSSSGSFRSNISKSFMEIHLMEDRSFTEKLLIKAFSK